MIVGREASSYEKGLLTGVGIGAVVGPSITLVIFLLIICYDLGRPQIIEIGQRAMSRILNLDEAGEQRPSQFNTPQQTPQFSSPHQTPPSSFTMQSTPTSLGNRQDGYSSLSSAATKIGLNLLSNSIQNGT